MLDRDSFEHRTVPRQKSVAGSPTIRNLLKLREVEQIHTLTDALMKLNPNAKRVHIKRAIRKAFREADDEWRKHYLPILLGNDSATDFLKRLGRSAA